MVDAHRRMVLSSASSSTKNQPSILHSWKVYTPYMKWRHLTQPSNMLTKLADTALRFRRLMLAREIRHLEAMVRSHTKTLHKHPVGRAQLEKTLQYIQELKQELVQLGENRG